MSNINTDRRQPTNQKMKNQEVDWKVFSWNVQEGYKVGGLKNEIKRELVMQIILEQGAGIIMIQ